MRKSGLETGSQTRNCLAVTVAMLFYVAVSASEKADSVSATGAESKSEETCYCDVRKQRQVEKRLRKQEKLAEDELQSPSGFLSVGPEPADNSN